MESFSVTNLVTYKTMYLFFIIIESPFGKLTLNLKKMYYFNKSNNCYYIKNNFSKQQKDIQSQKSHFSDHNTCVKLFYY